MQPKRLSPFFKLNLSTICQRLLLLLILIGLWAVPSNFLFAQEDGSIVIDVVAGFDGFYKDNHWIPVRVEVSNSGPPIEGELWIVSDSSLTDETAYRTPISLPTQSNKVTTLYVYKNSRANQVLELRDSDGRLILKQSLDSLTNITNQGILYGVVSSEGGELTYLEDVSGSFTSAKVAFLTLDGLPDSAVPLTNLDVLIFNDIDTSQLSPPQLNALQVWVESGGQLVVTGGNGWEKTVAAIESWLPVTPTGSDTFDDLPLFNQQVGIPFRDAGPYLVTTSTLRSGELIYHEDGMPILAKEEMGQGGVYFLAIDPRTAPLLDWDGSETVWTAVANNITPDALWQRPILDSVSAVSAVSSLPELNLPAVWQLFLFLLIYVLLMGPLNYIILKRRGQLDRAWLTIPIIVVLFSAGTYLVGSNIRGNEALINQIAVSYNQVESDEAQVQTLVGLYAPQRGDYNLGFPEGVVIRPLTENFSSFGGSADIDAITLGETPSVRDLRLDVGQIATFATQSYQPSLPIDGTAQLIQNGNNIELSVTLLNNSDQTLENGLLLYGDIGVAVGALDPGATNTVSQTFTPSILSRSSVTSAGGFSNPTLSTHVNELLGSFNYYNDPVLYPRWEFLRAIEGNAGRNEINLNVITFVFWTEGEPLETTLDRNASTSSVTLHFVEFPLTTNLGDLSRQTIPASLLDWELLEASDLFSPQPNNLGFNGSSIVAFEYKPLAELQQLAVEELVVSIEPNNDPQFFPILELWNWEQEEWIKQESATWGDTAVTNPTPYIGPDNAVRIRLTDQSDFGVYIESVYPILTGEQP